MLVHSVYFKTKHPKGSVAETTFLKAGQDLAQLPTVRNFQILHEVSPKNPYDFGFSMEFVNEADYQAYNEHPQHLDFVQNRWMHEVIDFLEIDTIKHEALD